jgi:DNA replication and repair protein RecF
MIRLFRAKNFRCLCDVELELAPGFNLVVGANASGKTSLLEALAYLGRGKSFRGANTATLLQHGSTEVVLFGELEHAGQVVPLGVRNSREGLELRVAGVAASGAAALVEALPLQVIDPEVHNLIAGGPEQRRRFIDWIGFHVEHGHLDAWRRFRRVLKQRNAALRAKSAAATIRSWNAEFVQLSEKLDVSRRKALESCGDSLRDQSGALLQSNLAFEYQSGWSREKDLASCLDEGLQREIQLGATQAGPHRADLKVSYDERLARKLVSRGQQKLLASAMILAATATAQASLGRPLLLLLDDPTAELDEESVRRLMGAVSALKCQVVATSLDLTSLAFVDASALFHVEQGAIRRGG